MNEMIMLESTGNVECDVDMLMMIMALKYGILRVCYRSFSGNETIAWRDANSVGI